MTHRKPPTAHTFLTSLIADLEARASVAGLLTRCGLQLQRAAAHYRACPAMRGAR